MATTTHEAAGQALYGQLISMPGWAELVSAWQHRVGTGEVSADAFAVYGQPFRGWTPDQLACAVYAHTMTMAGAYAWRTYFVSATPGPDRAREENAADLQALPWPLVVDVDPDQHCGDADGTISWDVPLEVNRSQAQVNDEGELRVDQVLIAPGLAPLEIGSTAPSRTLLHLAQEGAVVRWPYGCDYVQVLVNLKTESTTLAAQGLPTVSWEAWWRPEVTEPNLL